MHEFIDRGGTSLHVNVTAVTAKYISPRRITKSDVTGVTFTGSLFFYLAPGSDCFEESNSAGNSYIQRVLHTIHRDFD